MTLTLVEEVLYKQGVLWPRFEEKLPEGLDLDDIIPFSDSFQTHYKSEAWEAMSAIRTDPNGYWRRTPQIPEEVAPGKPWAPAIGILKSTGEVVYAEPGSFKIAEPYDVIMDAEWFALRRRSIENNAPDELVSTYLASFDRRIRYIDLS